MMTVLQVYAEDQWLQELVSSHVKASMAATWDGQRLTPYYRSCRIVNSLRGVITIFTRDVGYHTSGWWKNPDYERCYHLSLSFHDPLSRAPAPQDKRIRAKLVKLLFGQYRKWVWHEPPYTADGKRCDVHHYRLFCDEGWQPLKPRGEVYSRELTEAGWRSYSDVQEAITETGVNPNNDR